MRTENLKSRTSFTMRKINQKLCENYLDLMMQKIMENGIQNGLGSGILNQKTPKNNMEKLENQQLSPQKIHMSSRKENIQKHSLLALQPKLKDKRWREALETFS